jgi:competence protein ComGC
MPAAKKGMSPTGILLLVLGIIAALCVVLVGGCALMMNNVFSQMSPVVGCMMTSSMMEKSAQAYVLDHKGKFPNAEKWEDELAPYYERLYNKSEKEFKKMRSMPMVGGMFEIMKPGDTMQCGKGANATGFAFNKDLSGAEKAKVASPSRTPMFFEVQEVKRNNALPGDQLPTGTAPKIMGDTRKWIVFYVDGNENPFESSNSSKSGSFDMDFDPEDARDPKLKK